MPLRLLRLFLILSAFGWGVSIVGCGRGDDLEKTAAQLQQGMDKFAVKQLFVRYRLALETNEVDTLNFNEHGPIVASSDVRRTCKIYNTNAAYSSCLMFMSPGGAWDSCFVYFDTNNIIVGHQYLKIH